MLAGCGGVSVPTPTQAGSDRPAAIATDGASALRACGEDPFGCVEIGEGAPIVIGTALALSGPAASMGLDAQFGAQVAVNFRGDVRGHPVELLNEDDRCTADGGTAAADLLRGEGVAAVIGTTCSAAALPAAQLLSQDGILLLSPSATAPELTDASARPPFFLRIAPNDLAQAAVMARFACEELAIGTAATVHDRTDFAMQLEAAFVQEFEATCRGSITDRAVVEPDMSGAGAALERIARSADDGPPELLYVPFLGRHGARLVRQALGTPGLQDIVLGGIRTGLDGRADPGFLRRAGAAADGMYLSGPDTAVGGDFYETAFLEAYRNVSGADEPLSSAHARAFDAANLVLDAVAEVAVEADGALYVPRSRLLEAIVDTHEYQGLSGLLSCRPRGDCADVAPAIWQFDGEATQRVWP
jgi:branched-chain amino acid transport system substrate-binding protein